MRQRQIHNYFVAETEIWIGEKDREFHFKKSDDGTTVKWSGRNQKFTLIASIYHADDTRWFFFESAVAIIPKVKAATRRKVLEWLIDQQKHFLSPVRFALAVKGENTLIVLQVRGTCDCIRTGGVGEILDALAALSQDAATLLQREFGLSL